MDNKTVEFIERMGLLWEGEGMPRIAGRIIGLCLLSPEPCSLDQFAEQLKVSKASISNDARMLEKLGMIERISRPGDRKDYYQITSDSMTRSLTARLASLRLFEAALTDALSLKMEHKDVRARLAVQRRAYEAVIEALEKTVAELAAENDINGVKAREAAHQ